MCGERGGELLRDNADCLCDRKAAKHSLCSRESRNISYGRESRVEEVLAFTHTMTGKW